jgi:polar amino acid transport system substrate-binding protein
MKKVKKVLLALVATLMLGAALTGCSQPAKESESADKWAAIKAKGTIVVGLDDTFVPMGFKDKSGEIIGFDVDLAKEAAKRMNLQVKFQPIDWNLKETELTSGNIDLLWNGYSITDERKAKVDFTSPYLDNTQCIVTLSNSTIADKAGLKGKNVATQNASSGLEAIEKSGLAKTFKGGEPVTFDTYNEAFMDLEAGRVDAIVADEILARYYINERGAEKYKILSDNFGSEEYGVGVRKTDKTLLENLNKALDDMKADGTAASISKKWFNENIVK